MYLPYRFKLLPQSFDCARLQRELRAILPSWWTVHRFHDSVNEAVPLISTDGTLANADGSDNHSLLPPFRRTKWLAFLPYMDQVLHSFMAKPLRARLMLLRPGQVVRPHQDRNPHWHDKVRVHIPIQTAPEVLFHVWTDQPSLADIDCDTVHMTAGEAWVFNNWFYHAVENPSPRPRVHLVVDLEPTGLFGDEVFAGIPAAEREAALRFSYPPYHVDRETLAWMTGGRLEEGVALWKAIIDETARQGSEAAEVGRPEVEPAPKETPVRPRRSAGRGGL